MWRCFSTITDTWVSDWLSEKDYEEWLVQDAANTMRAELAVLGVHKNTCCSYNGAVYWNARTKYKEKHCNTCVQKDCDNCWLHAPVEDYIEVMDTIGDPLGIKNELEVS